MLLLDGKHVSAKLKSSLKDEVTQLTKASRPPCLAVILIGNNPASQVYVRNKEKACEEVGIKSLSYRFSDDITQDELLEIINNLNSRQDVDGILLQLPLPSHLNSYTCLERISPAKDVDGFHPINMGRLVLGLPGLRPCTPAGVMHLLEHYELSPNGKKAVVIGRSNIVGKPLAIMLSSTENYGNATVTVCHSATPNIKELCLEADFIFTALGKPKFLTKDMVKPGAVVVDIGINSMPSGLCGDCDFNELKDTVKAMTPVPGGVGPMTIAILLKNTIAAYKASVSKCCL